MLSFFPRDVYDEILDLIESVSEGFPTYSLFILQDPVTNEKDWYYPFARRAWKLFLSSLTLLFMVG